MGIIYATSEHPKYGLYAIDNKGKEKWFFDTGLNSIRYSTPAISPEGTIYQGAGNYLYAINYDGTLRWRFEASDVIWSSPGIDLNGIIYVGSSDTNLYAIYSNGTLKWSFSTDGRIESSPAIDDDGTIYFTGWEKDHTLFALYPNGTLKWSLMIEDLGQGTPVIGNEGTIYCYDIYDNLFAFHRKGTLFWKYPIPHGSKDASAGVTSSMAIDLAIGKDGTLYSGSIDGLYALNPDGSRKWKYTTDTKVPTPVVSADGTVIINPGEELRAIDSSGHLIWRSTPWDEDLDTITNQPIIGPGGTIYFMSSLGLYAVDGESPILGIPKTTLYAIILLVVVSILIVFLVSVKKSGKGNYFIISKDNT
jgi:outer membrane protein assembly factor BamB